MSKEHRGIAQAELRAAPGRHIEGYAAVFGVWSQNLGGFREHVQPGAFAESLKSGPDVRALIDHKPELILGRTISGTLELAEDSHGLHFRVAVPRTTYGNDLLETVSRGEHAEDGAEPDVQEFSSRGVLIAYFC